MTRSEGDLLEAPVPTARSRSGRGGDDQLATVRTVMALMAATTCAQVCTLLWQPRSGGLRVLDVGATTTRVGDHRAWLRRATTLTPGSVVQADDGVRLAPVHSSDGWFLGVLALRSQDCDGTDHGLAAAAEHVSEVLLQVSEMAERPAAYHALFEIGTQIQAAEFEQEAIFALIVARARQLLGSDVAWLALVDESGKKLVMKVADGTSTPGFMNMVVAVGTGIGGVALLQRRAVAVRDSRSYRHQMPRSVHQALDDEGIVSVLCAPMIKGSSMLGALYVGGRSTTDFTAEAASLLSALAAQAAVTIENARLYRDLSDKNDMLERVFEIHRSLTDASIAGAGIHQIGLRLAQLVERDLLLVQPTGRPEGVMYPCDPTALAHRVVDEPPEPTPAGAHSILLAAADTVLGTLTVCGEADLSVLQRKALEHGATVLTLEMVKIQAELEVEWRLQGELLEELLRPDNAAPGVRQRAARFGIDLSRDRRVIVMHSVDAGQSTKLVDVVRRVLRYRGETDSLVVQRGDRILIAVSEPDTGDVANLGRDLQSAAARSGASAVVGISSARLELALAAREAEAAVALAARHKRPDAMVSYEDLGPLRFLLDAPDTTEMQGLVVEYLGGLAAHDAKHHSDLLGTLRTFLETGGHHPTTAAACHIHISTLKYRLARTRDLLGTPLTDPAVRFRLTLAFEVLTVLEAMGLAPFGVDRVDTVSTTS